MMLFSGHRTRLWLCVVQAPYTSGISDIAEASRRGATIVTASTRAARHTIDQLESASRSSQRTVSTWATPQVIAWPHWLDRLWSRALLLGGGPRLRVLNTMQEQL